MNMNCKRCAWRSVSDVLESTRSRSEKIKGGFHNEFLDSYGHCIWFIT